MLMREMSCLSMVAETSTRNEKEVGGERGCALDVARPSLGSGWLQARSARTGQRRYREQLIFKKGAMSDAEQKRKGRWTLVQWHYHHSLSA